MTKPENPETKLYDLTAEMMERLKLLRDFAATPKSVWLARGELGRIN